jgi:hypothetical protein
MATNTKYKEIPADQVPNLRFDTPAYNGGQIVTVSYADVESKSEAGPGSLYKRIHDASDNSTWYYKRIGPMFV